MKQRGFVFQSRRGIGLLAAALFTLSSLTNGRSAILPAGQLAVDFEWQQAVDMGPDLFTAGWTFTANQNVFVTGLGLWYAPPYILLNNVHTVALWANNGAMLTSANVTASSAELTSAHGAVFAFAPITPFLLTAGQTYRVGSNFGGGQLQDFFVNIVQTSVFTDPSITYGLPALGPHGAGLAFPNTLGSPGSVGFFGPNLMLQVPEPRGISLAAAALMVALLVRARILWFCEPLEAKRDEWSK